MILQRGFRDSFGQSDITELARPCPATDGNEGLQVWVRRLQHVVDLVVGTSDMVDPNVSPG